MPNKVAGHSRQEPATSRSARSQSQSQSPSRSPSCSPSYGATKSFPQIPSVSKTGTLVRSKSTAKPAFFYPEGKLSGSEFQGTPAVSEVPSRAAATPFSTLWKNCQLGCINIPRRAHERSSSGQWHRQSHSTTIDSSSFRDGVRMLWADKHRPVTLDSFDIHYQQAMHLTQLTSQGICPHLLFQGPPGSGKRSLAIATIRGLSRTTAWKVNTDVRQFEKRDDPSYKILVPVYSSSNHVEVNLNHVGPLDYEVLTTIVKEMLVLTDVLKNDEDSEALRYKIVLLLNAQTLSADAWHFLRRTMDREDTVKFILCCDGHLRWMVEGFGKSARQVIDVESPSQEEVIKLLKHTALKKRLDLPKQLAICIASQANGNIRKALVALEACHAYQNPLLNDQVIHVDWEHDIVEIATGILFEQTPRRLHQARVKIQQLLVNCITPGLIIQRLVEELIRLMDSQLRREVCYWAAVYEQHMPAGSNAIFKLEEFVARFMSIYKARFPRTLP